MDKYYKDMGLVRIGRHLGWGYKHGIGAKWPRWFKSVIVTTWNKISCFVWGHDWFGPIPEWDVPKTCTACCKRWSHE